MSLFEIKDEDNRSEGEEENEGKVEGENEGKVEGENEGKVEGENEGKVEGENEGKVEGENEGKVEGEKEGEKEGENGGEKEGKVEGENEGKVEGENEGKVEGENEGKDGNDQIFVYLGPEVYPMKRRTAIRLFPDYEGFLQYSYRKNLKLPYEGKYREIILRIGNDHFVIDREILIQKSSVFHRFLRAKFRWEIILPHSSSKGFEVFLQTLQNPRILPTLTWKELKYVYFWFLHYNVQDDFSKIVSRLLRGLNTSERAVELLSHPVFLFSPTLRKQAIELLAIRGTGFVNREYLQEIVPEDVWQEFLSLEARNYPRYVLPRNFSTERSREVDYLNCNGIWKPWKLDVILRAALKETECPPGASVQEILDSSRFLIFSRGTRCE